MPDASEDTVRALSTDDADIAADVLAAAFNADPVFEWLIPDAARRESLLPALFAPFVRAYLPLGAARVNAGGVALWAAPGQDAVPEADAEEFGGTLAGIAGPDAERLFVVLELMTEAHPHQPCHYLNLLGVTPAQQGRGRGSALLRETLDRADGAGEPAYLEATSERNRRLYARHGFAVTGEIALPDGPSMWPMWREPGAG